MQKAGEIRREENLLSYFLSRRNVSNACLTYSQRVNANILDRKLLEFLLKLHKTKKSVCCEVESDLFLSSSDLKWSTADLRQFTSSGGKLKTRGLFFNKNGDLNDPYLSQAS